MYLGYINYQDDDGERKFFTEDVKAFVDENGVSIPSKKDDEIDMEKYAIWLNNPWSQAHEHWVIENNCKDAYTQMDESEPAFRCYYESVGYENITTAIYGYGNTPEEALQNCKDNFDSIQRQFNPDDKAC